MPVLYTLAALLVITAVCSDVVDLTDATFEHDTQAASGSTTGDWFVEFYAPHCGHCKNLAPTWELVASQLLGEVNVAKLDATMNPDTTRRFHIRGFPTLKLFHHGKVYTYSGPRTQSALTAFAQGGFKDTEYEITPDELTYMAMTISEIADLLERVWALVQRQSDAALLLVLFGFALGAFLMLAGGAIGSTTAKSTVTLATKAAGLKKND